MTLNWEKRIIYYAARCRHISSLWSNEVILAFLYKWAVIQKCGTTVVIHRVVWCDDIYNRDIRVKRYSVKYIWKLEKLQSGNEVIQGYIENLGHLDENINIGSAAALFVHADGAGADMEFLSQFGLVQAGASAELGDSTG